MRFFVLLVCVGVAAAQYTTTPVPILKQINRHNEDGSYSYGYEAADGSYKIESKYPTGEVFGKYGFVDDTGIVREVEYGASRRGFEPAGTGINVPPPTLNGNSLASNPNEPEDDGQYREDPSIYYTDPRYTNGEKYERRPQAPAPVPAPRPVYKPAPQYSQPATSRYSNYQQYEPAQPVQPQRPYQPQYQPYKPASDNYNTATYSVQYR